MERTAKTGMARSAVDPNKRRSHSMSELKTIITAYCPTCQKQVTALYSKPHNDGIHLLYACRECMKEMLIKDPAKNHLAVN